MVSPIGPSHERMRTSAQSCGGRGELGNLIEENCMKVDRWSTREKGHWAAILGSARLEGLWSDRAGDD